MSFHRSLTLVLFLTPIISCLYGALPGSDEPQEKSMLPPLVPIYNTFDIFGHLTETMALVAECGSYKRAPAPHAGFITHLPTPSMNIFSVGAFDPGLMDDLKSQKIPFLCFASKTTAEGFSELAKTQGLSYVEEVTAQVFPDLNRRDIPPLPPSIEVRRATTEEDLRIVGKISDEAFGTPLGTRAQFFTPARSHPDITFLIISKDGQDVGSGYVSRIGDIGGVYSNGVLPSCRRQGIGSALALACMRCLKEEGVRTIYVHTMRLSQRYFEALGFTPVGALSFYTWSPPHPVSQ